MSNQPTQKLTIEERLRQMQDFNEQQFKRIIKDIRQIQKGFGTSLEWFNISWFQNLLKCQYPDEDIKLDSQYFEDPECLVNDNTTTFKVDIFSKSPWLVAEVTSFLDYDEQDKVEKLVRIRDFLINKNNREKNDPLFDKTKQSVQESEKPELYFVAFDIHKEIKPTIVKFCQENKIHLIIKSCL